jgi:hypothetical protein
MRFFIHHDLKGNVLSVSKVEMPLAGVGKDEQFDAKMNFAHPVAGGRRGLRNGENDG